MPFVEFYTKGASDEVKMDERVRIELVRAPGETEAEAVQQLIKKWKDNNYHRSMVGSPLIVRE